MSLDTTATEADIVARVKTAQPGGRVWVTEVPDGTPTPAYPYTVLYFTEPIRSGTDHHITSTRSDTLVGGVTVQVVSTDADSANAVKNRIKDALVGYRPVDSGEMTAEGGVGYSRATPNKPTLYFREVGLSYRTNLSWVG